MQGGPIMAKDPVSFIRLCLWTPIHLPLRSITQESIICPKRTAHSYVLLNRGSVSLQAMETKSGFFHESEADKKPVPVGNQLLLTKMATCFSTFTGHQEVSGMCPMEDPIAAILRNLHLK